MDAYIYDAFGDEAHVQTIPNAHRVYLIPTDKAGDYADLALTPTAARRLAKALKKAAKEAESYA